MTSALTLRPDVVKHSATIQISHSITLLQHRAWNVLLAHAYDDLPTTDRYRIGVSDLVRHLGITTRNVRHIQDALRGLVGAKVEFNLLGKDGGRKWGVMSLLSEATIESGVVEYAYPPTLRAALHNPAIYARIKFAVANRFRSRYALVLYEQLVDYLGVGRTPWIALDDFRRLLGLEDGQYPTFKKLSQRVVALALGEINEHSDVTADVEYRREGRTPVALQFTCARRGGARPRMATLPAGTTPASPPLVGGTARTAPSARSRRPVAPTLFDDAADAPDAFEAWYASLPPSRAAALRERAEAAAGQGGARVGGHAYEAHVQMRLRSIWADEC